MVLLVQSKSNWNWNVMSGFANSNLVHIIEWTRFDDALAVLGGIYHCSSE